MLIYPRCAAKEEGWQKENRPYCKLVGSNGKAVIFCRESLCIYREAYGTEDRKEEKGYSVEMVNRGASALKRYKQNSRYCHYYTQNGEPVYSPVAENPLVYNAEERYGCNYNCRNHRRLGSLKPKTLPYEVEKRLKETKQKEPFVVRRLYMLQLSGCLGKDKQQHCGNGHSGKGIGKDRNPIVKDSVCPDKGHTPQHYGKHSGSIGNCFCQSIHCNPSI